MKTNTLIHCATYCKNLLSQQSSSSIETEKLKILENSFAMAGYSPGYENKSLQSIFSGLYKEKPNETAEWASEKTLTQAIDAFLDDVKSISDDGTLFDERVLGIARHHFEGLRAPVDENPDISLFSFLKTSAALSERKAAENPIALIGGDLSGLQSFLYDIVSKHAAKNLKGRSFYLQLLIEDILMQVSEALELLPWQVLYSSGGGFYILADKTAGLAEKLSKIRTERNLALFKAHGATLYLALDHIIIDKPEADGEIIGTKWKALSEKLSQAKAARYGELMVDNFDLLFDISQSADIEVDHITGRDIRDEAVALKLITGGETETRNVSAITKMQIELGRKLKEADYWLTSVHSSNQKSDSIFNFDTCKYQHQFFSGNNLAKNEIPEDVLSLKYFGSDRYIDAIQFGYGGNRYPLLDSETGNTSNATYEHFARSENGEIERLGVLRMDVDNLGTAFIRGFRKRKHVFGLYSELSFRMSEFFTHNLNKIIAENADYKNRVFVIYSGGDDLFAVGNWNVLMDFSKTVNIEFQKYMSGSFLTLSGGLTIVTSKYPILKASELAGEAEERAKSFKRNVRNAELDKNAIDLFGTPIGWEEFEKVESWRDQWLYWFTSNQDKINRSLLHKLYTYREIKNSDTGNLRWQWHAAYTISRRSTDSNKEDIDKIKELLFKGENKYRKLDLCCLGGRWADYLTRNQNN